MSSTWTKLVNLVIRPPRAVYDVDDCLPGPRFRLGGVAHARHDLELRGAEGCRLQCSHYEPEARDANEPLPCVVYLHGNSGSRCDATEAVQLLLPARITVFAVDLSGSGLSEGEYVTLGAREIFDVAAVVDHLREQGRTSKIGIWGQSMGAVTALLYANRDPSIAGVVLDSPFCSLNTLMTELVAQYTAGSRIGVPAMATRLALSFMRSSIKSRAKFDINALDVLKTAPSSFCPALFAHGNEDTFIGPHHSERLHEAYAGDKNLIMFDGDHNSPRPAFFFDSTIIFFMNTLHPPGTAGAGAVRELLAGSNGITGGAGKPRRDWNADFEAANGRSGNGHAGFSQSAGVGSSGCSSAYDMDGGRQAYDSRRLSLDGGSRRTSVNWSDASGRSGGGEMSDVDMLVAMGFKMADATDALKTCGGDVEAAVAVLIGRQEGENAARGDEATTARARDCGTAQNAPQGQGSLGASRSVNPLSSLFSGFSKHYDQQAEYAATTGAGQGNTVAVNVKAGAGALQRSQTNGGGGSGLPRPRTPPPTSGQVGATDRGGSSSSTSEGGAGVVADVQPSPSFGGGIRLGSSPSPLASQPTSSIDRSAGVPERGNGGHGAAHGHWAPPLSSQVPRGSLTGEMMDEMGDTSDAELARAISLSLEECHMNGSRVN